MKRRTSCTQKYSDTKDRRWIQSVFISSWLVSSITHKCYFYTSEAHLGGRRAGPTRYTEASSRSDVTEHMDNRLIVRMDRRVPPASCTERDCVTRREGEMLVRAEYEMSLAPHTGWMGKRGSSSSVKTPCKFCNHRLTSLRS